MVVRTRRPGGNRNERPRWEVHERHEDLADLHCHAAFERRRDALVFLDTTAVTPGAAKAVPKQRRPPNARAAHPASATPLTFASRSATRVATSPPSITTPSSRAPTAVPNGSADRKL